MPEGHATTIEVSNIMSFVLYTQILKQSVLKPASPGITLIWDQNTTESNTSASYLDLLLSIETDGQLRKRDDFSFHITNCPFLSSNIPSSPAYGVFISQLILYAKACFSMNVYSKGGTNFI